MNRFKLGEGTQGTKQTMKDSTSIFHWQRRAAEGPYRGPKKHLYKTLHVGLHELETSTAWVKQVPIPISPMSEARIGEGGVGWARKSPSHKGSKRGRNRLCKHSIDPAHAAEMPAAAPLRLWHPRNTAGNKHIATAQDMGEAKASKIHLGAIQESCCNYLGTILGPPLKMQFWGTKELHPRAMSMPYVPLLGFSWAEPS